MAVAVLGLGALAAWIENATDASTEPSFAGVSEEVPDGRSLNPDTAQSIDDLVGQGANARENTERPGTRQVPDLTGDAVDEPNGTLPLAIDVVDSRGTPAAQALVELEPPGDSAGDFPSVTSLSTGTDGRALFAAWPAAFFRVVVTPEAPVDANEAPLLDAERSVDPVQIDRSAPLRIQLSRASRIVGTLDCSDGSSPRSSGVDIFHVGTRSWTNAAAIEDGRFTSQWMPPGDVIVYARNGTWTETDLRLRRRFTLAEGLSHGFHGTLEPALVLEGTTVDATGRPAPGHTVMVVEAANPGNERSATSNEEGRFRIEGLHATDYDLGLLAGDQAAQRITLQRGSESTQAAPLVVRP